MTAQVMSIQIRNLVKDLEEFHGKALTGEARIFYVEMLSEFSVGLVREAVSRWRGANSPSVRFPSIAQLKAHIEDARAAQWKATKEAEAQASIRTTSVEENPEYTASRWALVDAAWNMTDNELVEAFVNMDRRYPNRGWDGAAKRLMMQIKLRPTRPDRPQERLMNAPDRPPDAIDACD